MELLHLDVLHEGAGKLLRVRFRFTGTAGMAITDTHEIYNPRDAVAVLLYSRLKGTVLLTRQFRIATALNGSRDGLSIEACAGKIEGETPEATAIRETAEECGYRISQLEPVLSLFMSPGHSTLRLHLFTADLDQAIVSGKGGGLAAEQEDIELLEVSFDQAWTWVGDGTIADAKTVLLLQHARLKGWWASS